MKVQNYLKEGDKICFESNAMAALSPRYRNVPYLDCAQLFSDKVRAQGYCYVLMLGSTNGNGNGEVYVGLNKNSKINNSMECWWVMREYLYLYSDKQNHSIDMLSEIR